MEEQHAMKVIARIRSDFTEKFGIPRQSGLVEALEARIVFEPEYRNPDAVRGMEGFSHIWLIWQFSRAVRANDAPITMPSGILCRAIAAAITSPARNSPLRGWRPSRCSWR